jgi:hypothetical protein
MHAVYHTTRASGDLAAKAFCDRLNAELPGLLPKHPEWQHAKRAMNLIMLCKLLFVVSKNTTSQSLHDFVTATPVDVSGDEYASTVPLQRLTVGGAMAGQMQKFSQMSGGVSLLSSAMQLCRPFRRGNAAVPGERICGSCAWCIEEHMPASYLGKDWLCEPCRELKRLAILPCVWGGAAAAATKDARRAAAAVAPELQELIRDRFKVAGNSGEQDVAAGPCVEALLAFLNLNQAEATVEVRDAKLWVALRDFVPTAPRDANDACSRCAWSTSVLLESSLSVSGFVCAACRQELAFKRYWVTYGGPQVVGPPSDRTQFVAGVLEQQCWRARIEKVLSAVAFCCAEKDKQQAVGSMLAALLTGIGLTGLELAVAEKDDEHLTCFIVVHD